MHSRRECLKWALALPATVGLATSVHAQEQPKVPQKDAQYQETPKNGQSCGTCKYYIAPGGKVGEGAKGNTSPGTCQLVAGTVNPQGWCALYAAIG